MNTRQYMEFQESISKIKTEEEIREMVGLIRQLPTSSDKDDLARQLTQKLFQVRTNGIS